MVDKKNSIQLGQKTLIVMALTMLSRIGGFLRDILLAVIFGASGTFDAFVIAFKIPNLIRRLFGEGAFAQAIVPALAHYRSHHDHQAVNQFINQLIGFLTIITLGIVLIGEGLAPILVIIFAPGFLKELTQFHLTVDLIRITQPYLLAMSLVSLSGAILNTYHRFAITAFTPVLLNLTLIVVAYFLTPQVPTGWRIYLLAGGVLLGGVFQLFIQWPALKNINFMPRLVFNWKNPKIRSVCWGIAPAVLGVSMAQFSLMIDNLFASFLPPGSISWLYYADRLIYLPLGVIGVTIATVVLPHLAHHHQQEQADDFASILDWGLRSVILIALPAAIGLFLLSGPILATLLHHGAFTGHDVQMTRQTLMAFSVGLPAWMIIKVLASAFYSRQNISLPAKIGGIALLINILLNFILIKPMAQAGLALATSIASWLNAVLLWTFLRKKMVFRTSGWMKLGKSIFLANLLMTIFLIWRTSPLSQWLAWPLAQSSWRLLSLIGLSIIVYLFGLWVSGLRWRHCRPPQTTRIKCN